MTKHTISPGTGKSSHSRDIKYSQPILQIKAWETDCDLSMVTSYVQGLQLTHLGKPAFRIGWKDYAGRKTHRMEANPVQLQCILLDYSHFKNTEAKGVSSVLANAYLLEPIWWQVTELNGTHRDRMWIKVAHHCPQSASFQEQVGKLQHNPSTALPCAQQS